MRKMMVVGTGPIGGIIGGRLARAGHDLTFVDVDPEHIAAIRERGLRVDVPDGAFNVKIKIVSPQELTGKFDCGFIAVRSNYTPEALATATTNAADLLGIEKSLGKVAPGYLADLVAVEGDPLTDINVAKSHPAMCKRPPVATFTSATCTTRRHLDSSNSTLCSIP